MKSLAQKPNIDLNQLGHYRLNRLRDVMMHHDIALCVLVNPVSMRYAVDFRSYQLFQSRIPTYYLFVPVEGAVILHNCDIKPKLVDELRPPHSLSCFDGGLALEEHAKAFTHEIKTFLADTGFEGGQVACEHLNPSAINALNAEHIRLADAVTLVEKARSIKSSDEIACMRYAIEIGQLGMQRMRDALEPGITENQLWSILHQTNIAYDGDWIDGRMLASGHRTNPWLQEATDKVIQAGELVAYDTDMIGPYGYCADISRTLLCPPGKPSAKQKDLYQRAYDEIQHNIELIQPGMTYKEFSQRAYKQNDEFIPHRYPCVAHGVGMCDEYPKIYYQPDWDKYGYDGVIEPNMMICIESYVGSIHGGEGVKLEEMVYIKENGKEVLSTYPFEEALLA